MDKRDFTVIENKTQIDEKHSEKPISRQTNPIAKKFLKFHNEKPEKFSVLLFMTDISLQRSHIPC